MEYNDVRALTERWLAGETTLAEEAALRGFFAGAPDDLPADLQSCRPLFGQSARAAAERSGRKLALHTGARTDAADIATQNAARRFNGNRRRLTRWTVAAASIAAAIVVGIAIVTVAPVGDRADEIVCVVNGQRITDPGRIAAYTREALELASDNLRRPASTLSSTLGDASTLTHVGQMLNELTITDNR